MGNACWMLAIRSQDFVSQTGHVAARSAITRLGTSRNGLLALFFQKFLDFDRSHAAGSGCSDGLTVATVLHVATGKHSVNAGKYVILRFQIAIGIHIELAFEHFRVGLVSNTKE